MAQDFSALGALVARLKGCKVAVLGDLVLDEFIYGEMKRVYGDVARISREVAFGLMLRQRGVDRRPGGAANAVHNLLALGARPVPFGFVGDDEAGRWLRGFFRQRGVDTRGVKVVRGWTTPAKTRIVAGSVHSAAQQVLRLDREELKPPAAAARRQLLTALRRSLGSADALLISDYGYGAAAPAGVNPLCRKAGALPVVVDSRYRMREYRQAGVLTPSVPELEEAFQIRLSEGTAGLTAACRKLLRETRAGTVVLTRGRHGMLLVENGRKPVAVPAFGAGQVADVTGAGDTVAATLTAALAAGAGQEEAAQLANVAAGLVVLKRGTATVTAKELTLALRKEGSPAARRRKS